MWLFFFLLATCVLGEHSINHVNNFYHLDDDTNQDEIFLKDQNKNTPKI